ncbi:hypothetical protein [Roseicella aerolata]|uniref:HrgA protein n=1 Tax=Roseicella aerolata TaxID=2883479 RepID=A0A9X1I9A2_9PROT|nr:hypothetical protein [Roseicella aerolata]MCB4820635.1 hypothetical protein [Roseicella aerolata]
MRPKLYYWQPVSAEASDIGASPVKAQPNPTQPAEEIKASDSGEKSLYEPFRQYLFAQKNILALRIDERKSKNNRGSGANRWLHPDIAGMLPKGASWNSEILQCARGFGSEVVELWSFEIKEEISTSNLRESFFQAVSNSSWATYGYLVATGVSGGQETLGELEMLCAAHGIGYMHFNRIIPDESRIVIPARKREMIDWDTMNRISSQNADFRDYTRRVSAYLSSTFLDPKSWSL